MIKRFALFLLLPLAAAAAPETLLESSGARLTLDGARIGVERGGAAVAEIEAFEFNFTAPKSLEVTGREPDRVTLRAVYPSVAKYVNEQGDLTVDIAVERSPGGFHFSAHPPWAFNTTVRLRDLDDHYFGVLAQLYPDNRHSPDLRGNVVDVEVRSDLSEYHENWASVWSPFYMTARGYAAFFHTFARGRYTLGVNGETELYHRTGALDWYLFFGRDGDEILGSYYRVIGAPKAPPLWGLGPIGWRDENKGGAPEVVEDVRHMTELRIPFTGWWVDRPYSDGSNGWSKMNFSAAFAHPEIWISQIARDYDIRMMSWVGPMAFGDRDFPGLLPTAIGYMDLSDPDATAEWERRTAAEQYRFGVRGHKLDRADEYFPETARWKDGTDSSATRNKFVFLYDKVVSDMLTRAWGDDHFEFGRAGVPGSQQYLSAVWGGDVRSSWDGMTCDLANAIRTGFQGFPVWGSDTGGYLGGRIDEELYARWLEFSSWCGLFEIKLDNNAGRPPDRPPWVYGERLQSAFREACTERMRMLPYLYSLARTSARHGVLMKPLAYVWPDDPATWSIADEYLFGPAFLVAPMTEPGDRRSVYLPEGTWYDLRDLKRAYSGRQTIEAPAPFEHIPVFVRANSLYVTGVLPIGNERNWNGSAPASLTIHATPGRPGERAEFELVDWFDHNRSKIISLSCESGSAELRIPAIGVGGSSAAPQVNLEVRCERAPTAEVNGQDAPVDFDAASCVARIAIPAGAPVVIRLTQLP